MNKKGMSILGIVLLLTALAVGAAISASDISFEQIQSVKENMTIEEIDFTIENYPEFEHALEYYINGIVKAYMELAKWVMEYSSQHPEVPYKFLLYLLIISLLAPIILVLFKLLIIIFLLIKEWRQKRKETKELMKVKYENMER